MKAPADRLAATLRRSPGASVPAPRRVLCAVLDALAAAEARAASLAGEMQSARWALDNSLRDRDALAAALDEADLREAAVARALNDRAGTLATLGNRAVEGYLEAHGWVPGRRSEGGRGFEAWHHLRVVDVIAVWPDEGGNRAAALWDVALACGRVEGRHATLVLADWLATEMRAARGKDGATG